MGSHVYLAEGGGGILKIGFTTYEQVATRQAVEAHRRLSPGDQL